MMWNKKVKQGRADWRLDEEAEQARITLVIGVLCRDQARGVGRIESSVRAPRISGAVGSF